MSEQTNHLDSVIRARELVSPKKAVWDPAQMDPVELHEAMANLLAAYDWLAYRLAVTSTNAVSPPEEQLDEPTGWPS